MVAGARSLSLEDTFLEPQVLNPPPTRHALLVLLLTLAALLHIGTAARGDLFDGVEGQLASGAKEMLETGHWLLPTNNGVPQLQVPPLVYWSIALSFEIFGVSAAAARVPIALATIGAIALTFLIGERLAGYWRGFAAGLILLCSGGVFALGRMVTFDSVFTLLFTGAVYCAVCGYQQRKLRPAWFAGFWLCAGLAFLAKGPGVILCLAGLFVLLAIFFREARLRFALLLDWRYLLLFAAFVTPWFIWAQRHFPGFLSHFLSGRREPALPLWQFLALHFGWWFPTLLLILPGLIFALRKIIRRSEFTFADALPLCWAAIVILWLLFAGERQATSSMSAWPAFALFAACAWERMARSLRLVGIAFVLAAGVAIAGMAFFAPAKLAPLIAPNLPDSITLPLLPPLMMASLLVFTLPALYFAAKNRAEIALCLLLGAMVPIGFGLTEGASRVAPYLSLAEAAQFLNPRLGSRGQVLFEGKLRDGNSLSFYLNKKFFFVNQSPDAFEQNGDFQNQYLDEHFVLEAWNRADPIYLIIEEQRVSYWRQLITDRVHIYHQVTACGRRVVLSNQL
ncbi:MAG TPA: glycosyltransferase family 39 protein [Chthoniobacterales bacterium]|nr:glycosyltransferase family 39 protein [Chthoniobacterales bacterium]